jgi:hypothetical protein
MCPKGDRFQPVDADVDAVVSGGPADPILAARRAGADDTASNFLSSLDLRR